MNNSYNFVRIMTNFVVALIRWRGKIHQCMAYLLGRKYNILNQQHYQMNFMENYMLTSGYNSYLIV